MPKGYPLLSPEQRQEIMAWIYASDFTYLPYFGKFVYLAIIEDVFTREIIGWEASTRHNADLVAKAMLNALQNHPAPLLAHSDQGSEYRSKNYLALLKHYLPQDMKRARKSKSRNF